jgi:Protein of unknown function (DUF1376)/HNH endonuclease
MSNQSYIRFYYKDYLADTLHFTATQNGAYILLLIDYWENGFLPEDDAELARIAKIPNKKWASIRDDVLSRFYKDSWWDNKTAAQRALGIGMADYRPAIPTDIRYAVVARDGFVCTYCGNESGPFDLDHKIPWSRGGEHSIDNLVVACASCNRSKGALTAEEWAEIRANA